MPKAARKGDRGRHDTVDLTAVQGSPDVFINGLPAVRVGDIFQSDPHPASSGSATVSINGKAAVRAGDSLDGHAVACTGSPDVFIGDDSYDSEMSNGRPVYKILLSQVPGSGEPSLVYANYPYQLFHNGRLVQEGLTGADGIVAYEYEPPLTGKLDVEMASGNRFDFNLEPFSPSSTRQGIIQRLQSLGYGQYHKKATDTALCLEETNSAAESLSVPGVTEPMSEFIKSKIP